MKHVSFDLETMGVRTTSAIVQIGGYVVDGIEDAPDPERSFKLNVDLDSALRAGLTIDASTIMWWLKQSDHARTSLVDPTPLPLDLALATFGDWVREGVAIGDIDDGIQIWSHGTFDAPILQNAYRAVDRALPVKYSRFVDLRTLRHFPGYSSWPNLKTGAAEEHDAAFDAWAQGQLVARMLESQRPQGMPVGIYYRHQDVAVPAEEDAR